MALNHARLPIPPLGQVDFKLRIWNDECEGLVSAVVLCRSSLAHAVTPAGFEPATHGLKVRCSAKLSYEVKMSKTRFYICCPVASVRGARREAFVRPAPDDRLDRRPTVEDGTPRSIAQGDFSFSRLFSYDDRAAARLRQARLKKWVLCPPPRRPERTGAEMRRA